VNFGVSGYSGANKSNFALKNQTLKRFSQTQNTISQGKWTDISQHFAQAS